MLEKRQYKEHYKLYQGYITKTQNLMADPKSTRSWLKDFSYNYSGAVLHQAYFNHIDDRSSSMPNDFQNLLTKEFGSVDLWEDKFIQAALACRPAGWAFLCYSVLDNHLHILIADTHDQFVVGMVPLITLDMYEHSYMIQYGTDKQRYIEDFINHLNWHKIYAHYKSVKD